ncbi:MAG: methylated-DNA--[protein]-cysteine S-methyltransferase [Bacteroidales bacterium]
MVAKELVHYNQLRFHEITALPDTLSYACVPTPFGTLVVAGYRDGICFAGFVTEGGVECVLQDIRNRWHTVRFEEDATIANLLDPEDGIIQVYLWGTAFQQRVWRALAEIPVGTTCSYGRLAQRIAHPTAVRAVASAVGANPVSWLLPCHRIIREDGRIGNYHWGETCKKAILTAERAIATDTATLCF